jgi:putative tricarboxylic transport membrane protein
MSRVKNPQDFWAGLLFLVIGIGAAYLGRNYTFGTATKMGPGYLPTVLSWGLAGIGIILILRAMVENGLRIEPSLYRPQFFILLAIVVFGLLIERVGLAPSIIVVACVASLASKETRWMETAILVVGLAVFCSLLFVKLLGQPLAIWAWEF